MRSKDIEVCKCGHYRMEHTNAGLRYWGCTGYQCKCRRFNIIGDSKE